MQARNLIRCRKRRLAQQKGKDFPLLTSDRAAGAETTRSPEMSTLPYGTSPTWAKRTARKD